MNKKINVLVFPCGAENALEIHNALRYSVHVNIIGASSIDDMGKHIYQNYIGNVPNIKSDNFDKSFSQIIKENNIDVVFATHDTVMEYLAKKNFNIFLINGDEKTTQIARSKKMTYSVFSDCKWCPIVYQDYTKIKKWPVLCKPDLGQGAQGIYICNNKEELDLYINKIDIPVVVEYLPGEEITIDCFTDRNKRIIWAQPRTREKVKAGISMKSEYIRLSDDLSDIVNDINDKVNMRGPWFFQVKKDNQNNWKLLEISCRISGTMVAQRAKGINLPLMAVQDYMQRDLKTLPYSFVNNVERAIFTKCNIEIKFSKVYIDFDDTIIINGAVVPLVISFIYEMKNQKKDIILITRHEFDLYKTLKRNALSKDIFSEIIHIKDKSPKSNYIKDKDSIFVDNHFLERQEVFEKCQIPVFDVDYLEFFIR